MSIIILGNEDVEMGKCMQSVGVVAGDSRDDLGKERFFPLIMEQVLSWRTSVGKDFWYGKYLYYPSKEVSEKYCLSMILMS